jgi:photosystem II stability/assembly factor-like uncharacterized protein
VLYHSANLGRSWQRQASWRVEEGGTWIEDSLAFVSPTTGWALGVADYYAQAPLITTDGGRHWSAVPSPHASADRVVPVGPALAWLVGDNTDEQAYWGTLQRTTDAGGSWTDDPRFDSVPLYDASWLSPARGWLFGDGAIYATRDGGRNWTKDFETRDAEASFTQATRTADSVFALGWDAAAERSVLYARRLSP